MKFEAKLPCATLVILQDARAMQATGGARMIRQAARSLSRAIPRLFHAQRVTARHTPAV